MDEPMTPPGFRKGRGQFWYRTGTRAGAYQWKVCEGCGELRLIKRRAESEPAGRFCSRLCAYNNREMPSGPQSALWRGDAIGYVGMHNRVRARRGKPGGCVWDCAAPRYQWANMTGDLADPDGFAPMCPRCHNRFDAAVRMMAADKDHRRWVPAGAAAVKASLVRRVPTGRR